MRFQMKLQKTSPSFLVLAAAAMLISCSHEPVKDFHHNGLEATEVVRKFVAQHEISGTELDIVKKIVEVMHNEFLFVRTDRNQIMQWIQKPEAVEVSKDSISKLKMELNNLLARREKELLSEEDFKKIKELQKSIFFGEHNIMVFENVIRKKDIYPDDLPFVVSGSEAVEYAILDVCTTATKTFIVLAKAAGLKDLRFVCSGNTEDYNSACPSKGEPRREGVTINGHFFALAKIEGKWALVNCTYFDPYAEDDNLKYEIFFTLDGEEITPEMLPLKTIRVPSFQREGVPPPPKLLYFIGVGKDSDDDMNIENYQALMNLSVSGDRDSSICRFDAFKPE